MNQTTKVINALDDSNLKSIEYENRLWLRQNVEKLNIVVCAEECGADVFRVASFWNAKDTLVIQEGKVLQFRPEFHPGKEALVLVKDENENNYYIFLYSPKE